MLWGRKNNHTRNHEEVWECLLGKGDAARVSSYGMVRTHLPFSSLHWFGSVFISSLVWFVFTLWCASKPKGGRSKGHFQHSIHWKTLKKIYSSAARWVLRSAFSSFRTKVLNQWWSMNTRGRHRHDGGGNLCLLSVWAALQTHPSPADIMRDLLHFWGRNRREGGQDQTAVCSEGSNGIVMET